jgi:hypothetical protein
MSVVYKEKIKLGGYAKRIEIEGKVASGELPVPTISLRWEKEYAPYDEVNKKAAGLLSGLNTAGFGTYLATIYEAVSYKNRTVPNYWLSAVTAARGVLILLDIGVDRNKALQVTADLVGLSKELIEKALKTIEQPGAGGGAGAGGGGAAAGAGGAPGA